jgi:hypothetical protein
MTICRLANHHEAQQRKLPFDRARLLGGIYRDGRLKRQESV